MKNLIKFGNVSIGYEKDVFADSINIEVDPNQFWGVMGPNGSGKTTLLKTVLNLIPPVAGQIIVCDKLVYGYVPQNEKFDSIFPISVYELVSMGRYSRVRPGNRLTQGDKKVIDKSIKSAGISDLKDRTFRSLSGGEKQRALLARAIAGEPDLLVLDEPTASIDIKGEVEIMKLIKKIQTGSRLAVIMVSHFLSTVSEFSDHLILIDKDTNNFYAGEKEEVLRNESLENFFGLNLSKEENT